MTTILYITFSKRTPAEYYRDASVIYRCFQPCEYWRTSGYQCFVMHHDDAALRLVDADVVVFHRPRTTESFRVLRAHYASRRCIADYDDCLFDSAILDSHPALLSGTTSLRLLKQQTAEYFDAFVQFDTFCVSTDGIKQSINSLQPSATTFVVRNGISPFWKNLGGLSPLTNDKKVISYFSGTANHSADLALHLESIVEATQNRDNLEVHVYGKLKLNRPLPAGWRRLEPVAFHLLPQLIRQSWICIAPIGDTPFNRCKSAIKFLESACFGNPLITQPLPEFARLANPGLILLNDNWKAAIDELMNDEHYAHAASAARELASQHLVAFQMTEMAQWI
ncbi:MAG: hypothetical protein JXX14_21955 [Deltaproteobacteria bacterium]|nr:hypothetical protein [Deltaproteobacteria bacterium]